MHLRVVLLLLALNACGSNRGTVQWDHLPERPEGLDAGKITHVATAGEERIVVLWDSVTDVWPCCVSGGAWSAVDHSELDQLWKRVGWRKPTPAVDFHKNVVFGLLNEGNACPGRVIGVDAEPGGVLRIRGEHEFHDCFDNIQARAQIVAVPKRLVHRRATVWFFDFSGVYLFEVPGVPE